MSMNWSSNMVCKCSNQGWCGRDSHRPNEYVCIECNGCLEDDFSCDACHIKFDLMTRVHFDLAPTTPMTTMWAIRDEVDKVLESQGLKWSYGEGYAPGYEVGWHGWIKDETPIHEVMKKWSVTDYNISIDHDMAEDNSDQFESL